MSKLLQDLRYSVRLLLKSPGFTAIAVLTIALGVGANSAIFSVVNAVLLRPLPYPQPDRLLFVEERSQQMDSMSVSWLNYQDWMAQNQVFEGIGLYRRESYNLTGASGPAERLTGRQVTANLLPLLGVQPSLGRLIAPEEDKLGAEPVVLLTDGLWRRRFGADPGLIGKTIPLNGREVTVIGVLPADFRFFYRTDIVVPVGPVSKDWTDRGSHPGLVGVGRLRQGATAEQAKVEMDSIAERLEQQYPKTNAGNRVRLTLLAERFVGDFQGVALVLLGAVGFVLLIACANMANLLLARAGARSREIAIRLAVGASRGRLVRQLLTESVLLGLLGGLMGLLLAWWGIELLISLQPDNVPRLAEIRLDGRVLAFTLGLAVLSGLLFGLAPALQAGRSDLTETLKEGGKGSAGRSRNRLRGLLVVAEVSLALLLLSGAGLMIRSFLRLQAVDPGFEAQNLLTLQLALRPDRYTESTVTTAFTQQMLEQVRSLPGVQAADFGTRLPLEGGGSESSFWFVGRPEPDRSQIPNALFNQVGPDYFQTLDIPLLRGRSFTTADGPDAPPVVIIDQVLADKFFPGQDPVGSRLLMDEPPNPGIEIIGVVPHIAHYSLEGEESVPYQIYFHLPQRTTSWMSGHVTHMTLFVRTGRAPMEMAGAVRGLLSALDAQQPAYNVRAMETLIDEAAAPRRFNMLTLGLFAGVALLLAAGGIYGVMAYSVTQRTQEIGIRMALGAAKSDVLRLVVGQGMRLALLGVGIGLVMGLAVSGLLRELVFGVSVLDPWTYGAVALVLAGVAALACYLPARKASRLDPMVALRHQ